MAWSDCFTLALDTPRRFLFEHGIERQVNTVWLWLVRSKLTEVVGDKLAAAKHD